MPTPPRIAIPEPTSNDPEYNGRCWPQYAEAIEQSGGQPVLIPLAAQPSEIARLVSSCQGVLLPGSPADVTPAKYSQTAHPASAAPDLPRENVDELLLQDAHNLHKPLLGICFGLQSLNVWRGGTLIQDLPPAPVQHAAGPAVGDAHAIIVSPGSTLAAIGEPTAENLSINSSHHQAIGILGDNLVVTARSAEDGVIEAVEGGLPGAEPHGHFVLAVQWHPERSFAANPVSRAIFHRFVVEAAAWIPRPIHASVDRATSYAARP